MSPPARVAIVTGASGGLGAAIATSLAGSGFHLMLQEGADEHAGEPVEVGAVREVTGRQRLPEQRPSRLDDAGLEQVQQPGVAFLFGEQ